MRRVSDVQTNSGAFVISHRCMKVRGKIVAAGLASGLHRGPAQRYGSVRSHGRRRPPLTHGSARHGKGAFPCALASSSFTNSCARESLSCISSRAISACPCAENFSPGGIQVFHQRVVNVAAQGQRVNHVNANVRERAGIFLDLLQQRFAAIFQSLLVNRVTRLFRLRQARHHVGGHEGMGLIRLPPAPSAVVMLEHVKALEPGGNLLFQFGGGRGWRKPKSFMAFVTRMLGRKLDMVCSTHP